MRDLKHIRPVASLLVPLLDVVRDHFLSVWPLCQPTSAFSVQPVAALEHVPSRPFFRG
jgi:hypothetical protein